MEQVSLASLWLPILISAVIIFFAAYVAWSVLPHHRSDWVKIPNDRQLLLTLRVLGLARGQYFFPAAMTPEGRKQDPDPAKTLAEGPVGSLVIWPGAPNLGTSLASYFVYTLGVSFMVAYIAYATIAPGADYLHVFRVTGTVAVLAYSAAEIPKSIWFGHTWSSTWKSVIDGLVYGLLTGGVFGWLWPG